MIQDIDWPVKSEGKGTRTISSTQLSKRKESESTLKIEIFLYTQTIKSVKIDQ